MKMEQYYATPNDPHASDTDFMSRYEMELVGPSPFWKPQAS